MSSSISFQKPKPLQFLRVALIFTALLGALALSQFQTQIVAEGLYFTSLNFRAALWGGYVFVILSTFLGIFFWTKLALRLLHSLAIAHGALKKLGPLALLLFGILLLVAPFLVLGFYGRFLLNPFPRLFLFWLLALAEAALLAAWSKKDWLGALPMAALGLAAVYLAATFFNLVRTFPFSLEWSEISRYYQASFYFSQQVYGLKLPLPVTHPSRYLLQSLPFLIANSPLWLHRLWQALLWVCMPLLTSWLLARRLKFDNRLLSVLFILWSFLFLMQGAVFYHLLPCVFLVLIGFDKDKPARSFLFVALASFWAGISRVNWVPLPGALAALLYLLETRPPRGASALSLRYLWQPFVYGAGGSLVALASYAVYITHSGVQDLSEFGSAFTSALLWDRLLPNAQFPPGVILGILVVSAPVFALLWLRLRQKENSPGLWRGLGITFLLAVFFFGGLVVSVKIGGGTNLHNLDAYMVLLWVLTSVVAFGFYAPASSKAAQKFKVSAWLAAALLAVPILFAIFSGAPLNLPNQQVTDAALVQIQQMADQAIRRGGDVLFISQRHLLTFHLITGVPLVPEYEKLFLTEMTISNNVDYLNRFIKDIDQQRFTLIITDPLYTKITDTTEDVLSPENNAWVRFVSRPVLCAYEVVATFSDLNIQMLTPRYGNKCNQ
jgi:hypothetical protein